MATVEELQKAAEHLKQTVEGPIQLGIACALGGSTARHAEIAKDFDDLTAAYRTLGRAEGAEQIKAMNVGIVTYRDGILGLTEGHDLRYPLVQGATYVLIRVCVTDGAMDGHATMKPASVFAPKEPEVKP